MEFDNFKQQTRYLEQNIENLLYAQYESNNDYGIPELKPCIIDNLKDIPLQGFNYALSDKHPEGKGVHFFLHDYQFERVWNYPQRYTDVLYKFAFVLSPDFSVYADMPKALRIYNVYRNRWCGRYWQEHGIKVIPTFTMGDDDSISYCTLGIPKHSTVAISTMGEGRWAGYKGLYANWDKMIDILQPNVILLYGKNITENLSNKYGIIIHKQYVTSSVAI